jgi:hypothetical protein
MTELHRQRNKVTGQETLAPDDPQRFVSTPQLKLKMYGKWWSRWILIRFYIDNFADGNGDVNRGAGEISAAARSIELPLPTNIAQSTTTEGLLTRRMMPIPQSARMGVRHDPWQYLTADTSSSPIDIPSRSLLDVGPQRSYLVVSTPKKQL